MSRDPRHDILFEPVPIGPKTMRNRFYQSPHCTSFGAEVPSAHAYLRGIKAEGGWAVVNTEFCSVHPSSDSRPLISARLWDAEDARNLKPMADMAHEYDSLAGVELWHGGGIAGNLETRIAAGGASQMAEWGVNGYQLDKDDIRRIQGYYVEAAKRARDAGFDIVNVHGAEGGAITAHFLMAKSNNRTDEYGGSLENRARFWTETLEQVREAVGEDCAVTARLCIDTYNDSPQGIRAGEEAYGFIALADHLVDFWDLQAGGWSAAEWAGDDAEASRFGAEYADRPYLEAVRGATQKPIAAVGRFTNPDTMAEAVRSGTIDVIAAARPSIADPFLPQKIEEGRYEDIRECIGCNICASRFPQSAPIVCTQNATVGEEFRRGWHPEKFAAAANAEKTVLVLGAGPAGMECARVLGERGMSAVHLVDEGETIGGSLRRVSAYPKLGEWARVINYRQIQLDKLANVEVIPKTRLDAEGVLDYGAEIVVIATGSSWRADGHGQPQAAAGGRARLGLHARTGRRRRRRDRRRQRPRLRRRRLLHRRRDGGNAARCGQAGDRRLAGRQPRPVHVLHRRGLPRQPPAARRGGDDRPPAPAHRGHRRPRPRPERLVPGSGSSGRPTRSSSSPSAARTTGSTTS